MISSLEETYSLSATGMEKSVIRELLKLTRKPEIISFAGGLPDPAAFPVEEVADITVDVLKNDGRRALQYSPTEGDPRLKEEIISEMRSSSAMSITSSRESLPDLSASIRMNMARRSRINLVCSSSCSFLS